ncbi:hypothetical protein ACIGD1_35090 [Streptomyces sp. NPDC085612]|uniref:hypothetical protein n=1 Tax=Streptomyces sp. NPDC085612 TaxID=3365732 RepID=UPI0037CFBC20
MADTWIRIALAASGVVVTMAGAVMYVLPGPGPGPGLPVLVVGLALLAAGVIALGVDHPRR